MTKETDSFSESEISLEDYLLLLLRKWWIVSLVLVAVIILVGVTSPPRPPDIYEAEARVLLSDRSVVNGASRIGELVPPEIAVIMATSDDVLARVVLNADLQSVETDLPWAPGRIADAVEIDILEEGGLTEITMTGRHEDPELARRIVMTWADIFVDEFNGLLETEETRVSEVVLKQYEDAKKEFSAKETALVVKEEEKLAYQADNSVEALRISFEASMVQFQEVTNQLTRARVQLVEVDARLDILRQALDIEPDIFAPGQNTEGDALAALLEEEIKNLEPGELAEPEELTEPDYTVTVEVSDDVDLSFRRLALLLGSQHASLTAGIVFMENEISDLDSRMNKQSAELEIFKLEILRFNKEIVLIEGELSTARSVLLKLEPPANPESSPLFAVQSVKRPQTPIPTSDPLSRRLMIGALVGLILGVAAAFAVDYLQRLRKAGRQADTSA